MLDLVTAWNGTILLKAHSADVPTACPDCKCQSSHVHSHYCRKLLDLPWQGQNVQIELTVRKLYCDKEECKRRVFTERLPKIVARYARKTERLADALRELAFLAGGEAAARIAHAFGLSISPDVLLDFLHKMPTTASFPTPKVLGVDDFAFRKGRRYGTILVDLERRCPVDLLPDREADSLVKWLQAHPGVEIISRDRGGAYIEGATKGAPNAVQVADRFHLVKNLGDALERFLLNNYATISTLAKTIAAESVTEKEEQGHFPALNDPPSQALTAAEQREKQDRRSRRLARYDEVKRLQEQGLSQREIARRTGLARNTIRRFVRPDTFPEIATHSPRRRKTTPFAEHLRKRWTEGCYNAVELYQEIVAKGFTGSLDLVQRFVATWREKPRSRVNGRHPPPIVPTSGNLAFHMMNPTNSKITEEIKAFTERLTQENSAFSAAQSLCLEFCRLIRERDAKSFPEWLAAASDSQMTELQGFARGLIQDRAAVEAALTSEWSNGQVEGQVNRLKFIKRSMYGSASFDLLKARVLHQPRDTKQLNQAVS